MKLPKDIGCHEQEDIHDTAIKGSTHVKRENKNQNARMSLSATIKGNLGLLELEVQYQAEY